MGLEGEGSRNHKVNTVGPAQFKLQVRQDIRNGVIGRRDVRRTNDVSANLIQLWLTQFDRGELNDEEAEASAIAEYELRIAALERKVAQLTMELDLAKNDDQLLVTIVWLVDEELLQSSISLKYSCLRSRIQSHLAFSSGVAGSLMATSPVRMSIMTWSGWGRGSGPVMPKRSRRSNSRSQLTLWEIAASRKSS